MKEIYKTIKDIYYPKKLDLKERITSRGFIFNEENKFALLHILTCDEFGVRDHYETPGGGRQSNETNIECLKREIKEELGFTIKNINEIGIIRIEYNLLNRLDKGYFYYAKIDQFVGTSKTKREKEMVKEISWFSIDDAIKMYQTKEETLVGKMIHERDLAMLLYLKEILKDK